MIGNYWTPSIAAWHVYDMRSNVTVLLFSPEAVRAYMEAYKVVLWRNSGHFRGLKDVRAYQSSCLRKTKSQRMVLAIRVCDSDF